MKRKLSSKNWKETVTIRLYLKIKKKKKFLSKAYVFKGKDNKIITYWQMMEN